MNGILENKLYRPVMQLYIICNLILITHLKKIVKTPELFGLFLLKMFGIYTFFFKFYKIRYKIDTIKYEPVLNTIRKNGISKIKRSGTKTNFFCLHDSVHYTPETMYSLNTIQNRRLDIICTC